jgi:hypothetical protein
MVIPKAIIDRGTDPVRFALLNDNVAMTKYDEGLNFE